LSTSDNEIFSRKPISGVGAYQVVPWKLNKHFSKRILKNVGRRQK